MWPARSTAMPPCPARLSSLFGTTTRLAITTPLTGRAPRRAAPRPHPRWSLTAAASSGGGMAGLLQGIKSALGQGGGPGPAAPPARSPPTAFADFDAGAAPSWAELAAEVEALKAELGYEDADPVNVRQKTLGDVGGCVRACTRSGRRARPPTLPHTPPPPLPQGPTNAQSLQRLFGSTSPPRVKLYRDDASWAGGI